MFWISHTSWIPWFGFTRYEGGGWILDCLFWSAFYLPKKEPQ